MRYRFLLLALTLAAFLALKVIDYLVPWPAVMFLLCLTLVIMICHSAWLALAQKRWQNCPVRDGRTPDEMADNQARSWEPWVDIFIPAKNEASVIEATVRGFFKLNYSKYWVWVIDDASTDETPLILQRLQQEFPRLRVVRRLPGSQPGKSAGLNEALPLSKGEVIAVFDADASVDPDFLKGMLPVLAPEGVGAVQAQKRLYPHRGNFLIECQASEYATDTYFQMGRDLIGGAVELRGNGQLVKRSALIDVGGWNNRAITDDLDLTMRLLLAKWDVRFCPHEVVWEEGVPTWKALVRQRRRWAEGSIRRYLDYIFPLNSPRRLSFVERIDILAFVSEFAIPALVFLEAVSEVISLLMGSPVHPRFLIMVALAVLAISSVNFFIALRTYRRDDMTAWQAFFHTFAAQVYVYLLWPPVVMKSFLRVFLSQHASAWHRTEHVGNSA